MDRFVSVDEFQEEAFKLLPKNALDYYKSGAGRQETLRNNRSAFSKFKIRPKCLRDVSKTDLSATVLGEKVSIPVGISPSAMQRMAHPDGECASARAAQGMGTIFILSTIATSSIEEVAEAAPEAIKWFQLYIYKDRHVTRSLVKRAEDAGFKALVLTVDTPMFGLRLADIKNKFQLPSHLKLANFQGKYALTANKVGKNTGSAMNDLGALFDASLTWDDIRWLKSITKLPIVLKGILTADDAISAADAGASAVMVSNHGARQVDGWPASIEALPEITKAVGHRLEVYVDGGFSDGTDIFKALGLGARMVFLGRPVLWGLACGGEEGVKKILTILKIEFEYALAISGCSQISDIKPSMVVHESYYARL
ncbi:2-Hydroxyacid oxidase 1 [Anthonomus grandis grandis]|uniref:2-Hydroxyacid oxidase 1 n=1 Tax=Anthonomus grandis grandis TaxID=2921223 RepID=UPI002165ED4A|nr:2-Hydroxyacid oxidase 1 [Anthonomus grandis grandis]